MPSVFKLVGVLLPDYYATEENDKMQALKCRKHFSGLVTLNWILKCILAQTIGRYDL